MYNSYTITSVTQGQNGDANVVVSISGDNNETPQSLIISTNDPSNIDQQVQDTINQLNSAAVQQAEDTARQTALTAFLASPPIGQAMPAVTLSPQDQYQQDLESLLELKATDDALGIDITTDQTYLNLQALVNSEFDPSFSPVSTATLSRATNLTKTSLKAN